MAIEIFNRYEKKYRMDENVFRKLRNELAAYMIPDAYNKNKDTYPICNLYYDTEQNDLIRTSLKKPHYKEKLRIRSYGTAAKDAMVFVEIKKKCQGLVNKRRSAMHPEEAYSFLESKHMGTLKPYMNAQVIKEVEYLLSRYTLKPKVYLSYERMAYFGRDDDDLRISFDTNILTRRQDLHLQSGIYGKPLLEPGQWLMEIKTSKAMPLWLTQLLADYQIYPHGFSKYGTEYLRSLTGSSRSPKTTIFVPQPSYLNSFSPAVNI